MPRSFLRRKRVPNETVVTKNNIIEGRANPSKPLLRRRYPTKPSKPLETMPGNAARVASLSRVSSITPESFIFREAISKPIHARKLNAPEPIMMNKTIFRSF
jgi:hypothetical protein